MVFPLYTQTPSPTTNLEIPTISNDDVDTNPKDRNNDRSIKKGQEGKGCKVVSAEAT